MPNVRPFDVVLFGATGFTGGLTAEYLAKNGGNLRWALAGRNVEKLEKVRARLDAARRDANGGGALPEVIQADATDAASLRALAESTRIAISTVGPYLLYGEPLVAACAAAGTDYLDLTGESPFATRMAARYHAQAEANGAKIIHSCGFDSIPHDLGVQFTVAALRRGLSDAEAAAAAVTVEGFVRASGQLSGGTWQSMLNVLAQPPVSAAESGVAETPGRSVGQVPARIRYRKEHKFWAVPMPSIDPEVVCHSGRLLPSYGRDFKYGHYLSMAHLTQVIAFVIGAAIFVSLARFKPTRLLLAKARSSGQGPNEAERAKGFFEVLFVGQAGPRRVRCRVRGGDPGYGETAKMLAESALCLAFDRERLPACYGVVPTAAALGAVLTERLQRAGIVFEELSASEA
jgi:saccharopine dehydrogenase (NAD+, L-glutamate forming)